MRPALSDNHPSNGRSGKVTAPATAVVLEIEAELKTIEKEIADMLGAAVENEQQHADSLQGRIIELKSNPSRLGFLFQVTGKLLSLKTRIFGKLFMLKTDILIEKRAIKDYRSFLKKVKFDEKSVDLIEIIIRDEERHVCNWQNSIKILKDK